MICAGCQTPAPPDQRFCRSCGSRLQVAEPAPADPDPVAVLCPRCQHDNPSGRKFCRACGTALSLSGALARPSRAMPLPTDDEPTIARSDAPQDVGSNEAQTTPLTPPVPFAADRTSSEATTKRVAAVGTPCEMCGVPAGGRRFCLHCDPSANTREQTVRLTPAAPHSAGPDDAIPGSTRPRVRVAIIAAALALMVAGAAIAVVLFATEDNAKPARPAAGADPAASTVTRPAVDEPASGAAPGDAAQSDRPNDGAEGATDGAAQVPATGPENALREYWEAIGGGDFSAAYDRFSSSYRTGRDREAWSTGMRGYRPEVEIVEIKEIRNAADRAIVRVIVATRDRGDKGDASRCHVFRGRVRVVREGGKWLYHPSGLRETRKGGIDPSSDERCEPLFR